MPLTARTAPLRRLLRWTLWTILLAVLFMVATFLYVSLAGITIDASPLKAGIARTFSDHLGRTVRFDGPMRLEISGRPRIHVGGFHIANAPGFDGPDLASLGDAKLALDLWALLHGRLRIEEFIGSDVQVRLQNHADGANNWTFRLPKSPADAAASEPKAGPDMVGPGRVLAVLDVRRVALERLDVEYVGPSGKAHYFDLHTLTASSPIDQPFALALNGAVEKAFPYRLDLRAGTLSDLASDNPWPVQLKLTFLSSTLTVNGAVRGSGGEVRFEIRTGNLTEFERLIQRELPKVGATTLSGTIAFAPRRIALKQLRGVMGRTTLAGEVDIDYTGARPRVTGALVTPTLDLRPFLGEKAEPESAPPASLAELYRNLSDAAFSLHRLNDLDADVVLRVERWLSLPGNVRDAALEIRLEHGRLELPVRATIADVALSGRAIADGTASPAKFRLALGTRDSDLGGLAELLFGARGIKGELGRFDLRLSAAGDRIGELTRSLDVRLAVERGRFSYGNIEGGRPVHFTLDGFTLALPAGKSLRGELRGSLLGNRITARLRGGALEPMMLEGRSPIDFRLRSGEVQARIGGTVEPPARDRGPEIAFALSAPRAGEVASWFGFEPGAEAPATLSGKAALREDEWRISELSFRLGRTSLVADLQQRRAGPGSLLKARFDADRIDVEELQSLLPASSRAQADTPVLDIPILPQRIDLKDSDVDVRVKRVVGISMEVNNASFDGHIREGFMQPSRFAVQVADAPFSGAISLDLRGEHPQSQLWLSAENVDVGAILHKLGLSQNLDATLGHLRLYFFAHSHLLSHILGRSEIAGTFGDGRVTLRDANTGAQARIAVDNGELHAEQGKPVTLAMQGALDDTPVSISIEAAPAADMLDPALPLPFKASIVAAGSQATLSGRIARPIADHDVELALDANGARFDALDKLVRTALPPWGPWSAAGRFRMSRQGYEVADLRLKVGQSVLAGDGRLDTTAVRPRLDVSLDAPNIQLDDFRLGDWWPEDKKPDSQKSMTAEELRNKAAAASDQAQKLLSPEVLRRQDVHLKVRVQQVLSGADRLGAGRLDAKLENGRAEVGPAEIDIPGGSARLQLAYEPTDADVKVELRIRADRFDYGILARRIKPNADLRGKFSVNLDVSSRARYLSDVLRHGSGYLDFAVWPENMRSGIFDLWAVNVLVALVPVVDPGKASKVNCAIGSFQLADGKLSDRGLLLDTSRVRVTGKGSADFAQETLYLRLKPQAKTAQFLSLATPIEVKGPFKNFQITVSPGDVAETIGRLATSVVWVPLQKLFGKKIPQDGRDVCSGDTPG